MKSPKELSTEKKLITAVEELLSEIPGTDRTPLAIAEILISDTEIQSIQDYANAVSIVRLGFNDHGPVHARKVALNSMKMLRLLYSAGIKTSLENEETGTFIDSMSAVLLASFLHDTGMTVGRHDHELYSSILALPIITRILETVLPASENLSRLVVIRSLALEGIIGHMGTRKIHSLESGIVLIADGCDMTKGRARIPMHLNTEPKAGDIHKYSANSIESVALIPGNKKPVRIEVRMSAQVGFFQIEEVLLQKIYASPAKQYVELLAGVDGEDMKQYL